MKNFLLISALAISVNLFAIENGQGKPEQKLGDFVWNELATPNVREAKEFYGKMFGWEFVDKNMGDMTYTIIKNGSKEIGGIWAIPQSMTDQIPPHWVAYILVENVEKTLEKVRNNGGTVIKGVQKAGDMGYFAIIQDRSGAHFALWQQLKK